MTRSDPNHPPTTAADASNAQGQGPIPIGQSQSNAAPAAIRTELANKGVSHHHTLSTSPRSNPALSDPDYWPDREGEDDVFSNPDTAELDARSDATGATSPDRAMSPIVGSPDITSPGSLAARARDADSEERKRNEQQQRDLAAAAPPPIALHHRPSQTSQLTQTTAAASNPHDRSNNTPTPSTLNIPQALKAASPQLGSQSDHHLQLPPANELPQDPNEASHISSLFVHPPAPPSAFASHGSPAGSSVRLALSAGAPSSIGSPIGSTSASAAGSPLSERNGFQWTSSPMSPAATRAQGKTVLTRPHSPDRQRTIMPSIANTTDARTPSKSNRNSASIASTVPSPTSPPSFSRYDPGLGLGLTSPVSPDSVRQSQVFSPVDVGGGSRVISGHSVAHSDVSASVAATESSIFERDIEHRDASHILSKSEAVDVAIPPVLDDAVEAIIDSHDASLEIVEPIPSASPVPAALSAMALTAHTMASSPQLASSSTTNASSPRLSQAMTSPGEAPPPGSIAAQIAEKLSPARSALDDSAAANNEAGLPPTTRHRTTHSSSASSVSSSMRSRSPGNPTTVGVQQVLDGGSGILPSGSTCAGSPSRASAAAIGRGLPSSSAVPATPSRPVSQHIGLPLPNPFRSESPSILRHSPSASVSSSSGVQGPSGPVSMSLDGAVIPSAESAIRELSLDGMADALADESGEGSDAAAAAAAADPSPILPRKAGSAVASPAASTTSAFAGSPSTLGMFGRRDTEATITPATTSKADDALQGANALADVSETMPGGMPSSDDASSAISAVPSAIPSHVSSTTSPRRLSFFSYADIINETPAEVIDLEAAIQKKATEDANATAKATGSALATHRPIISSTSGAMADVFAAEAKQASSKPIIRGSGGGVPPATATTAASSSMARSASAGAFTSASTSGGR